MSHIWRTCVCVCVCAQGYTSDSDTKGSSMSRNQDRTFVRRSSSLMKRLHSMQRRANAPPQPISEEEMLGILSHFPKGEWKSSVSHTHTHTHRKHTLHSDGDYNDCPVRLTHW